MIDSFNYKHPEFQYLTLMRNILENVVMVENPRTNSKCLTIKSNSMVMYFRW